MGNTELQQTLELHNNILQFERLPSNLSKFFILGLLFLTLSSLTGT